MRVIHFDWLASRQRVAPRLRGLSAAPSESNGWAIGPSKSASGHVMLLSNSHLQWGDRHTYFEVQLTAPGVTSYGAVWVGFPVLRQCFTEHLGWTQTTNGPNLATRYLLSLKTVGISLEPLAARYPHLRVGYLIELKYLACGEPADEARVAAAAGEATALPNGRACRSRCARWRAARGDPAWLLSKTGQGGAATCPEFDHAVGLELPLQVPLVVDRREVERRVT